MLLPRTKTDAHQRQSAISNNQKGELNAMAKDLLVLACVHGSSKSKLLEHCANAPGMFYGVRIACMEDGRHGFLAHGNDQFDLNAYANVLTAAGANVLVMVDPNKPLRGNKTYARNLLDEVLDALDYTQSEKQQLLLPLHNEVVRHVRGLIHDVRREGPAQKKRCICIQLTAGMHYLLGRERPCRSVVVAAAAASPRRERAIREAAVAAPTFEAINKMYIFLYQGLWVEQMHYEVVTQWQNSKGTVKPDTLSIERAVEEDRAATWVQPAKCKKKKQQLATMEAMLTKGACKRGIVGFLWRHPECRVKGVITQAVKHHKYSETFGRILEGGWMSAFRSFEEANPDMEMSDEEEGEGVLGL